MDATPLTTTPADSGQSPSPAPSSTPSLQQHAPPPPPNAPQGRKNGEGGEETAQGESDEQREGTGQVRPRSPKTVHSAEVEEGKEKRERIIVLVRSPCQENSGGGGAYLSGKLTGGGCLPVRPDTNPPPSGTPPPGPYYLECGWNCQPGNHLEERLSDQAQARASYTPLFWGHSCSIPQGMILDVQPLVKSLFCPIRPSPNGFFDSEASIP